MRPIILAVGCALGAASVLLLAVSPGGAQAPAAEGTDRAQMLYAEDCQSCHGPRGEGVAGLGPDTSPDGGPRAGPDLTGAGPASVDFYLSTGYMPLSDPRDQPRRSEPEYSDQEIDELVDYVVSFGGDEGGEPIPEIDAAAGDVAEGQEIFADKCAGCHQVVGEGGLILDGTAPELRAATDTQVAEAVRIGPYLMPRFGAADINDAELDSLVRYVAYSREPRDEGGWGIGHIGPIPEGLVAWIVAALGLVAVARVIGKRMGAE